MKTERGTKRAQRRDAAHRIANNMGIPSKLFPEFWHAGATHEAGEEILKAGRAREADAALARATMAVATAAEKQPV